MKYGPGNRQRMNHPIQTTILELLHTLSDLMQDDRLVLSAFKSIFASYNVRLAHSSVPVRLVGNKGPDRANRGRTSENRHTAWA
jgi:hypothetical protein